jgi:hypothetical protein
MLIQPVPIAFAASLFPKNLVTATMMSPDAIEKIQHHLG